MTDVSLRIVYNWMFIVFRKVTNKGTLSKDNHTCCICPCVYAGIPCSSTRRVSSIKTHHICRPYLVQDDNDALYSSSGEDSQLNINNPDARQLQIRESIEGTLPPAVEAFLNVLTRGYLSFSFLSSDSFNKFIKVLITEARLHPTVPSTRIFPTLTYHSISRILHQTARRKKSALLSRWRNSTLGISFDGGKIGHKKYTVVCARRLDCPDTQRFWLLEKEHKTKEDFKKLFAAMHNSLAKIGAHVGSITIDGEASQRFAIMEQFSRTEFEQLSPDAYLRPIHILLT